MTGLPDHSERERASADMITRIVITGHKAYWTPEEDCFYPLQAGAALHAVPAGHWGADDTGENISEKNRTFCELTGLYWAWKNLRADILGLCHYRRYFGRPSAWLLKGKEQILKSPLIEEILEKTDVILPRKRHYWIETRESQYAHAHHVEDLWCAEAVISERYPEYLSHWKWMLETRSGHICNMFIMRRELADAYCAWLFDILFETERRLDISAYCDRDRRVFGFLGERLLDVWIHRNGLRYTEVPMINLEKQHWIRKGTAFVRRKLKALKSGDSK